MEDKQPLVVPGQWTADQQKALAISVGSDVTPSFFVATVVNSQPVSGKSTSSSSSSCSSSATMEEKNCQCLHLMPHACQKLMSRNRLVAIVLGIVMCLSVFRVLTYFTEMPDFWIRRTEQRLPHCIIVGVRKCGTRALLEFLNVHPQVRVAQDEVHFFNREDNYKLGLEWYRRHMPFVTSDDLVIEKTPGYYIAEAAPYRIHHMNSSIRLLLIVRDPVVRTISDYMQGYSKRLARNESYPTFEELVYDEQTGSIDETYKPVQISLYYQYWTHWLSLFPRSQIHIVDGDRLVYDPLPELQRVETFLGLSHWLTDENFYFNRTRGFFCMRNGSRSQCLGASKGRPHPQVNPKVLRQLTHFFQPYNDHFMALAGQKFNWTRLRH